MQRISHHPVATVCAGILLKERLEKKEMRSIDGVIMELIKDVTSNCQAVINNSPMHHQLGISESLIMAETLIAMTMKMLLCDKPHLSSSFDMMSACAPRTPIPSTFLSRYLRHPSLKLPSLKQPTLPQSNLQQMFKTQPTVDNKDESLDPKGKAWSNKSITEYITKIEGWFTETWQAVKEVYNLYYGEIPLEKVDNSIQILQDCELLVSSKLQPGGMFINFITLRAYLLHCPRFFIIFKMLCYIDKTDHHHHGSGFFLDPARIRMAAPSPPDFPVSCGIWEILNSQVCVFDK